MLTAIVLTLAGCQGAIVLSGKYVSDSSAARVEVDSDFPRITVRFDMGSEIAFEADGNRENFRAVNGQRVMMETYAMGGGVPCIVDEGFARFHKESLRRQRFRFSFQCHYEGQNGTSGYSFDGQRD